MSKLEKNIWVDLSGPTTLTHIFVEHVSSCRQQTVWRVSENVLGDIARHRFTYSLRLSQGISKVEQSRPRGSPSILESNQSRVITIGATHIKFVESIILRFLDRFPHQKVCPTQIVEAVV